MLNPQAVGTLIGALEANIDQDHRQMVNIREARGVVRLIEAAHRRPEAVLTLSRKGLAILDKAAAEEAQDNHNNRKLYAAGQALAKGIELPIEDFKLAALQRIARRASIKGRRKRA